MGENAFGPTGGLRAPEDWRNEQFVGRGAPRALWVGLRSTLSGARLLLGVLPGGAAATPAPMA